MTVELETRPELRVGSAEWVTYENENIVLRIQTGSDFINYAPEALRKAGLVAASLRHLLKPDPDKTVVPATVYILGRLNDRQPLTDDAPVVSVVVSETGSETFFEQIGAPLTRCLIGHW